MADIIFYDTETSDVPKYGKRSDAKDQPHIVQLAGLLVDEDTREIKDSVSHIIRPDGWDISPGAFKCHGISHERAMDEGLPEKEVFEQFIEMWRRCSFRVAHSEPFDARIIRIATFRFADKLTIDDWDIGDAKCSMQLAKPICQIPASAKNPKPGKFKNPNLAEAYKFFTGKTLENAHDALADAKACMNVYFGAINHGREPDHSNFEIQL